MKIGILTLAIAENYGGTVQAVALYRLLHAQGHEVVLIYKVPHVATWKKIVKKVLLAIPFHNIDNVKTLHELQQEWQVRKEFHRDFIEKEIFSISGNLETKQELECFVEKESFDAVIVGSDQVWRKDYINDKFYKSFFLDFVNSKRTKKISYAASFGKDSWGGSDDKDDISTLLKDFTAVSTREFSGTQICKNSFGYDNAAHVLDPTFLMDRDFYVESIIANHDTSHYLKGGLLTYVLDEAHEKKKIIDYLETTLNTQNVNHLKGFDISGVTYSVPEWLRSFAEADYVVTDSFHGMVFSIIFQKNFTVIGNANRGLDRFKSLLNLLNIEERLVLNFDDMSKLKNYTVDYQKVNEILEHNKNLSLSFLLNGLGNVDEK